MEESTHEPLWFTVQRERRALLAEFTRPLEEAMLAAWERRRSASRRRRGRRREGFIVLEHRRGSGTRYYRTRLPEVG